jgi:hypothetical protein
MLRIGEATVKSRGDFKPSKCLTCRNLTGGVDLDKHPYLWLDLPSAKTARPGEQQSVWLVPQGDLCAISAHRNLAEVVPARADDPLFSWRDSGNAVRPMAKPRFMEQVNNILTSGDTRELTVTPFALGGVVLHGK